MNNFPASWKLDRQIRIIQPEWRESIANDVNQLTDVGWSGDNLGTDNDQKVIEDLEHGHAANGEPAPLHISGRGGTEDAGENHDHIGEEDSGNVVGVHVSENDQVDQKERGGEEPVDVASKEERTVHVGVAVRLEEVAATTACLYIITKFVVSNVT